MHFRIQPKEIPIMAYIAPLNPSQAQPEVAATLQAVKNKLGILPNLFATLAQAPVALNGYLNLSEILSGGRLSGRQREIVALAIGQANACQYCLSAHTLLAKGQGLNDGDIRQARAGKANAPLDDALARLAARLTETRGRLPREELEGYRSAGVDDGLLLEVIAAVALNTLTNYVNHVAATDIDFPVVAL